MKKGEKMYKMETKETEKHPRLDVQIPLTPPKIPNAFAFGIFTYSLFTLPYSLTNAPGTKPVPGAFFYTLSK